MDFRVDFSEEAELEIDAIYDYIANKLDNPGAAERLHGKIIQTSYKIADNPYIFRLCFEERLREKGYRRAIVDNFIMLFTVDEDDSLIIVRNVVYGRRDLGSLI
jgi:plasmid stabilization system protein ParE